jgi:putative tryptophan/tyrosine transport system substrate-binding protein
MAMRRRAFIAALGSAAAWPMVAGAQQRIVPTVGYLSGGSPTPFAPFLAAFREGLRESGYTEGQNVAIEYRWAEGNYDRLPALATDLVGRNVDVIAASGGDLAARAAKGATSKIPIVFTSGDDPVITGLVGSLAQPGANLTGVGFFIVELHAKRFELISELVPNAKSVVLLVNPSSPQTERVVRAIRTAVDAKGLQLHILKASTASEIDDAFAAFGNIKPDVLIEQSDPFFNNRRQQFALLAARYAVPAIYEFRQFVEAGGLISYGPSLPSVYHQVGAYAGRILKGEKPSDLPVMQPTKFEMVVNLTAAKAIGLSIPEAFLIRADEVIE